MMNDWISINDKLPPDNEWVLIYTPVPFYNHHILIGGYYGPFKDWHILHAGHTHTVTHWMPLPVPPTAAPDNGDWQVQNAMLRTKE